MTRFVIFDKSKTAFKRKNPAKVKGLLNYKEAITKLAQPALICLNAPRKRHLTHLTRKIKLHRKKYLYSYVGFKTCTGICAF